MRYIFLAITVILTVSVSAAQPDQCDVILREALAETNENCEGLPLGTICNGSGTVQVTSTSGEEATTLSGSSETLDLGGVSQVATSSIDLSSAGIGVAVMNLPVENPETQEEESVALVLVGDATLEILDPIEDTLDGITIPAFLLKGGSPNPDCSSTTNGLLVQTPQDMPYTVNINSANVTMSSTVYFRINDDRALSVATLEGRAVVGPVEGERTTVVTGFTSQIELDPETDQISGEWSDADLFEEFDTDEFEAFENLDASFLNYEIDVPDEDYFDEIEALIDAGDFDYEDFADEFDDFEDEFFDDEDFEDDEFDVEEDFEDDEFFDDEDFEDDEFEDEEDFEDDEFYDDEFDDESIE